MADVERFNPAKMEKKIMEGNGRTSTALPPFRLGSQELTEDQQWKIRSIAHEISQLVCDMLNPICLKVHEYRNSKRDGSSNLSLPSYPMVDMFQDTGKKLASFILGDAEIYNLALAGRIHESMKFIETLRRIVRTTYIALQIGDRFSNSEEVKAEAKKALDQYFQSFSIHDDVAVALSLQPAAAA